MTTKFNPKVYQDKKRIWKKVPGAVLMFKILEWDGRFNDYREPPRGNKYLAKRHELADGKKKLATKTFETLEQARSWQQHGSLAEEVNAASEQEEAQPTPEISVPASSNRMPPAIREPRKEARQVPALTDSSVSESPLFRDVVSEWKRRNFSRLAKGTQSNYERYLRIHFQSMMDVPMRSITPRFIDSWLDERKEGVGKSSQSRKRENFDHELNVLRAVLRYYTDYYEDPEFRFPLKARHAEASRVGRSGQTGSKSKDLTVEELDLFIGELLNGPNPQTMATLAVVQYFQALRISEAAALHWEDVILDWKAPEFSRVLISRHVVYLRGRLEHSYIEQGFKNSSKEEPVKEQPMFPRTFTALKSLFFVGARGLIFRRDDGSFLTYREIQHAYDHAFARAGLPYSGTHVLRHGGTRNVYNETGDLAVAQQLLGNSDLKATLVYAKRHKSALTKVAAGHWERSKTATVG